MSVHPRLVMAAITTPYGFPPVLLPSPNKFDAPPWTATSPNPNYAFTRISARTLRTISWESFKQPYLIFGRDLTVIHVFVGHPTVSGQQAAVVWDRRDGRCYIKDLESANGTFINDKIVSNTRYEELHPGCRVRFGKSAELFIFDRIPGSAPPNPLPIPPPDDKPIPIPVPPHDGRRTPPPRSPGNRRRSPGGGGGRSRSPAMRQRSPHGGRPRIQRSPGPRGRSPGPRVRSPGPRVRSPGPRGRSPGPRSPAPRSPGLRREFGGPRSPGVGMRGRDAHRRSPGPGHGREVDGGMHGGREWERPRDRFDRRYEREFDDRNIVRRGSGGDDRFRRGGGGPPPPPPPHAPQEEFDDRRNQGRNSGDYNRRDYDRMRSPGRRNSRDGYR